MAKNTYKHYGQLHPRYGAKIQQNMIDMVLMVIAQSSRVYSISADFLQGAASKELQNLTQGIMI